MNIYVNSVDSQKVLIFKIMPYSAQQSLSVIVNGKKGCWYKSDSCLEQVPASDRFQPAEPQQT
jgi:hypothetical protein